MAVAPKRKPYEILKGKGYTVIRLFGNLEIDDPRGFTSEIPQFASESFGHVVINCDHIQAISKAWLRALVLLARCVRESKKFEIRLVCVAPKLQFYLHGEGVDKLLPQASGLKDALIQFGLADRKSIDTEFINPFLAATVRVLEVQTQTVAKSGKIFARPQGPFSGDVSGVIGVVAESFEGSVVITFPQSTFLKVMSRMLGEEFTQLSKELSEGAGELINIIFGRAKLELNKRGYGIQTALPSVVTGLDHSVGHSGSGPIVVIPFESDAGAFYVEICTAQSAATSCAPARRTA